MVWHPVVHVSKLACVPWLDVEGEVDVDDGAIMFERCSKILADGERLGEEYRRLVVTAVLGVDHNVF